MGQGKIVPREVDHYAMNFAKELSSGDRKSTRRGPVREGRMRPERPVSTLLSNISQVAAPLEASKSFFFPLVIFLFSHESLRAQRERLGITRGGLSEEMGKNRQFLSKHVRNEVGSFVEPEGDQFLVSFIR